MILTGIDIRTVGDCEVREERGNCSKGHWVLSLSSFNENIKKFQLPHNCLPSCKTTCNFFFSKTMVFKKFVVSLMIINKDPFVNIVNIFLISYRLNIRTVGDTLQVIILELLMIFTVIHIRTVGDTYSYTY